MTLARPNDPPWRVTMDLFLYQRFCCSLTVSGPITSLDLNPSNFLVGVGSTYYLLLESSQALEFAVWLIIGENVIVKE